MISIILRYNSDSNSVDHCKNWIQRNTKNNYELIELIDSHDLYGDLSKAVENATSEIVFLMDDSVCVSTDWDEPVIANTKSNRSVVGYLVEPVSSDTRRKSTEKDFGKDLSTFKYEEFINWANTSKKFFPYSIGSKECFTPCGFLKKDWPKHFDKKRTDIKSIDDLMNHFFSSPEHKTVKINSVFYKLQKSSFIDYPKFVPVKKSREQKITTIINYCTNDYMFLKPCVDRALRFSHKVIVSTGDHFFDGSPENHELIQKSVNENPNVHFIKCKYDKTQNSRWHHNFARRAGVFHAPADTEYFLFLDVDEIIEPEKFILWWQEQQKNLKDAYRLACHWYFRDFKYRAKTPEDAPVLVRNGKLIDDQYIFNNNERRYLIQSAPENMREEMCTYNGEIFVHHYSWVRSKEEMLKKVKCWGQSSDRDWSSAVNLEFSEPFRGKDIIFGKDYEIVKPYINCDIRTKYSLERKPLPNYIPRTATLISTDGSNLLNLSKITDELKQVSDVYLLTNNKELDHFGKMIYCGGDLLANPLVECGKWIADNFKEYDYFFYSDDNTLLRAEQLDSAIFYQSILPIDKMIGILRYVNIENKKFFVDTKELKALKNKKEPIEKIISHKSRDWFSLRSPLVGNFLIHRSQADWLIANNKWDIKSNDQKQALTYPMFEKYLPIDYAKICVEYIGKVGGEQELLTEKDILDIIKS